MPSPIVTSHVHTRELNICKIPTLKVVPHSINEWWCLVMGQIKMQISLLHFILYPWKKHGISHSILSIFWPKHLSVNLRTTLNFSVFSYPQTIRDLKSIACGKEILIVKPYQFPQLQKETMLRDSSKWHVPQCCTIPQQARWSFPTRTKKAFKLLVLKRLYQNHLGSFRKFWCQGSSP